MTTVFTSRHPAGRDAPVTFKPSSSVSGYGEQPVAFFIAIGLRRCKLCRPGGPAWTNPRANQHPKTTCLRPGDVKVLPLRFAF